MGDLFAADRVTGSIGWREVPVPVPSRYVGHSHGYRRPAPPEILRYRFWDSDRAWDRYILCSRHHGHISGMAVHGNHAPDNARPVMDTDLSPPIFLSVHLWLLQRKRSEEAAEPEKSS